MSTTPHDSIFKWTFSQIEHAGPALQSLLPGDIAARIDFSTLRHCPGSFVDEELRQRHSDLLFSATLGGRPARIYLLWEHLSTSPPLTAFQLLRYEMRIWEGYLEENPSSAVLPAIVAIVLHHSKAGWTAGRAFEDLLDLDADARSALGEHVPRFRFLLVDLSVESDEALRDRPMSAFGRLVLFFMKYARALDELFARLRAWRSVLREARRAPNGREAVARLWMYIFKIGGRYEPKKLLARLSRAVGEEEKEELVNVAEKLIAQGRQEGLLEGQRITLLKLLTARFGALPGDAVRRVQAAGVAELDRWTERVLTAPTLAQVLGKR